MLKINVKSNFNQVLKEYETIKNKRLPMQWGFALNDTGFWLANQLNRKTADYFDKPVPAFTKKAFGLLDQRVNNAQLIKKRLILALRALITCLIVAPALRTVRLPLLGTLPNVLLSYSICRYMVA
mgnify:CR=1 FL=1